MNKKLIRLTEQDLHRIVKESVNKILNEVKWKDYRGKEHSTHGTNSEGWQDVRNAREDGGYKLRKKWHDDPDSVSVEEYMKMVNNDESAARDEVMRLTTPDRSGREWKGVEPYIDAAKKKAKVFRSMGARHGKKSDLYDAV